jgi:hypothetical protein
MSATLLDERLARMVQSGEGKVSYDLQPNAVCAKVRSDVKRVCATACTSISLECNSACALSKSKTQAMASYLKQLYEAYPAATAGPRCAHGHPSFNLYTNELVASSADGWFSPSDSDSDF